MRICSFLPSGTEILFALGLGDSIVGVTFECDYPPAAREKAVVVYTNLPSGLPEKEIDRQVNEVAAAGQSLYRVDANKLRELRPDLIVTQDLCHVCAASPNDLGAILGTLSPNPIVLPLSPRTLADVWSDIAAVGEVTDRASEAWELVSNLRTRIADFKRERAATTPRILCLEWLDPPFVAGHWVPEMVELAGGIDVMGLVAEPGFRVSWEAIAASDPDLILAMPCGFHQAEVESELKTTPFPDVWYSLRAVRNGNVFAVDASSYFSRPGPRLTDGIAVMATLFQEVKLRKMEHAEPRKAPAAENDWRRSRVSGQR
jgi:iron complex transport system substrate-binding protein